MLNTQSLIKTSTQPDLISILEPNISLEGDNKIIDPLSVPDYFNVADMFTLRDLFDARVHLGHKVGLRNEHMKPYLFGERLGCDIIDLENTQVLLREALNFVAHIAYRGGIVLFVSRDSRTLPRVERTARRSGEFSHCRPWAGGTFTNCGVQYGGVTRLPDVVVFPAGTSDSGGPLRGHCAVAESAKCNVPTVGVVDSTADPRLVAFPVPGNDDSPSAVELYCDLFEKAILQGKRAATEK